MTGPAPADNADQRAFWNGAAGERWATLQARIDAAFAPVTAAALAVAAPAAGTGVLDVGCGAGASVLALAEAVGPSGRVLGVDVSRPLLEVAERRAAQAGLVQARFLLADAATHAFAPGGVELVFSRFGVMFFADPAGAFRNIQTALRTGGRLAFVCWQPLAANPWVRVPLEALRPLLPSPEAPADPLAPGPFAFADPDRVRAILEDAGFGDIAVEPHRTTLRLSGPADRATAVDFVGQVGPVSRAVTEAGPDARPALVAALDEALVPYDGPEGVELGGAVWLVSAWMGRKG